MIPLYLLSHLLSFSLTYLLTYLLTYSPCLLTYLLTKGCAAGGPLRAGTFEVDGVRGAAAGGEADGPAGGAVGGTMGGAAGDALGPGPTLAPRWSKAPLERCYTRADQLPLLGAALGHPPNEGGWSLIDGGVPR